MKKSLIALAVLSVAGMAHAQSNVTVYGAVDIGYKKDTGVYPAAATSTAYATTNGWTMAERYNTRLGVMGTEELGGGLKATFQVEQRFTPMSGQGSLRGDFEGAANVGLAGGFGQVRFGRLNELSTETYRRVDPFDQYGVAGMIQTPFRGENTEGRLSYTARYDSPNLNGFKLGATYTVKNSPDAVLNNGGFAETAGENAGYGLSGTYTNGPVYLVGNYNKPVNANDSYSWNVGGSYAFGPLKVSLGFEQTENKLFTGTAANSDGTNYKTEKNWIIGAAYTIGAGVINASYNHSEWSPGSKTAAGIVNGTASAEKWALGYTHNLSKRTSLYANYARTNYEGLYKQGTSDVSKTAGSTRVDTNTSTGTSSHSGNAYEIGITHKF